ncbi:MAG: cob(I)yrinic acid a,c-diamide adenosyltransferase [Caldisphaeraceae archaeon]|nr:cob(I)yrinic acid a,c-diamide adenosyltransferase [Caldisphaeraceae archaeon]
MGRIFTATGDDGNTYCNSLKARVPKDHPIIELIGSLDEVNSFVGMARALVPSYLGEVQSDLKQLQYLIFRLGFHISGSKSLNEEDLKFLEGLADKYYGREPLKNFVLPSGPLPSSSLHVARTVARRAERSLVRASKNYSFDDIVFKVINRLSSVLFAMAIYISRKLGYGDEPVSFR